MALTRAQLLSGDQGNGIVLSNQPQGVRPGGAGITIGTDGIISVNSQTIQGVMKLGQTPAAALAAYNQYDWPTTAPTPGQQLTAVTVAGVTTLAWSDSDGIPWTAKGQLIVGTGVGADTILNAGTNTSILMADSGTLSGLAYSNGVTSAMLAPAGNTAQRPNPATAGQIRYNSQTGKFEFATGPTTWEEIASGDPAVSTFVVQTVPTTGSPSAVIPSGTTAQQQTVPAPLAGYTRFNIDTALLEVFDGLVWTPAGAPPTAGLGIDITGSVVKLKVPIAITPPTPGTLPAEAIDGSVYWDSTLGQLFIRYNDGFTTQWVAAAPPGGGGSAGTVTNVTGTLPIVVATSSTTPAISVNDATTAATGVVQIGANVQVAAGVISVLDASTAQKGVIQIATQAEQITGTDLTKASTPGTSVAKTTADQTGFVVLPLSAAAPATTGYFHYNSTSNHLEYYNGSAAKTVVEVQGDNMTGKLSVTPTAITAGSWALTTSNYWTLGAIAVPQPTALTAGQGGLIEVTAIPTSWPAAGGTLKYAGGTAPVIAAVPAIIPYYSDGTNVLLGTPTENIT